MSENTGFFLMVLIVCFTIMFVAHTIGDYNSFDRAMKFCLVAKEGPDVPVKND